MTFEEVWITSRSNCWSFLYPLVIAVGIAVLIALSFIRGRRVRIGLKVVAIFGFSYLAIEAASWAISEKWRIRWGWVKRHFDSLSEAQQDISMADGANLVLGPIYYGFLAFVGFVVVVILLAVVFRNKRLLRFRTKVTPR